MGREAGGLTRDGACMMSWLFPFMNEAPEAVGGNRGLDRDQRSGGKVMKLMVKVREESPQLASSGSTWMEFCSLQLQICLNFFFFNFSLLASKRAVLFLYSVFNFYK